MSITIDPTVPQSSEVAAIGASRIRTLAGWLQQMFGALGTAPITYTLPPIASVDTTTGLATVQGVPTVANGIATKGYVDASVTTLTTTFTSGSGIFTTALTVPYYLGLVIGGGGGGGIGGAGINGASGGSGAITVALLLGGGQGYTYTVGGGGAPGSNGAFSGIGGITAAPGLAPSGSNGGLAGGAFSPLGIFATTALVLAAFAGLNGVASASTGIGGGGFLAGGGGNGGPISGGAGAPGAGGLVVFSPGL